MIPYSGIHAQRPFNDWPQAAAQMPAGTWVKYLDNVQALDEAKRVNPGIKTVLRHFDGGWQQFDFPDHAARREHARRFIASFIDGTFMNYAHNVDAIEEFNEYTASSHSDSDRRKRELWAQAALEEWSDWRDNDQRLAHIRLVVGNVAIGNDMPLETARQIQKYDGIAGYHPYIPFRHPSKTSALAFTANLSGMVPVYNAATASMRADDVYHLRVTYESPVHQPWSSFNAVTAPETSAVLVGEWPHLSGRWTEMDKRYRAAGITVEWLGTEAGPIGYYDWGGLDPMGGWRHEDVCAGDVQLYLQALDYWTRKAMDWNAQHDGRFLGQVLYNSGGTDEWKWFETPTSVWLPIVDMMKTFVEPDPEPEPPPPPPDPEPDPEPEPRKYHRTAHLLPQDATLNEMEAVLHAAYDERQTVLFSADDAFSKPPEITGRTVYVWEVERVAGSEKALKDWVNVHFPPWPTRSRFRRIKDLFVADRWDAPVGTKAERAGDKMPPGDWVVSTEFNQRYQIVSGGSFHRHTGWDLNNQSPYWDSDRNMPIRACANGRVIHMVEFPDSSSWGKVIVTEHVKPDGQVVHSRHAHMAEFAEGLEVGHWIRRGTLLGTTGRTNVPNGAYHHHWDISLSGVLVNDPGHWCFDSSGCVATHYVNPGLFVQANR